MPSVHIHAEQKTQYSWTNVAPFSAESRRWIMKNHQNTPAKPKKWCELRISTTRNTILLHTCPHKHASNAHHHPPTPQPPLPPRHTHTSAQQVNHPPIHYLPPPPPPPPD